jgi:hypothetical protein
MNKTLARIMSALVVLVCAGSALAQGGFVRHTAPTAYQGYSDTIYRVCATNDASPCTTTPIYSDSALVTVVTQTSGVTLPQDKIAKFYVAPGVSYVIQWYSAQGGSGYYAETIQASSPFAGKLGVYQGTTAVGITDTAFHALIAAASDVKIPANFTTAGKTYRIHAEGVYTNAAASLLNVDIQLCTVSGCATGTVVAPAGCAVVTTNQANNLTNGQWKIDCDLIATSTVGASGTFMAKATVGANLGAATSAVSSQFQDTVVAVSAAVDETVAEFVNPAFKFSTSNASNFATVNLVTVDVIN